MEGRLEIISNGRWGTICDDLFDSRDGLVACRQLGFASLARIGTDISQYGQGRVIYK